MPTRNENTWELSKERFGLLWPFIIDDQVTDVDWDSDTLWIKYADGHKESPQILLSEEDVDNLTHHLANHVGGRFNQIDNMLYADTNNLRITMGHESFIKSGTSIFIRKSLPKLRFLASQITKNGYVDLELLHFLVNCIQLKLKFAICGEPGHGKTEFAKFMSSFIPASQKVITIEDAREWYYKKINKGKRGLEFICPKEEYAAKIDFALRSNTDWIMLSEARGAEAKDLIRGWSTGVGGITTLHTDDVRYIPDRIITMIGDYKLAGIFENEIFTYLHVGILVAEVTDSFGNTKRKIKQVSLFTRENEKNICTIIYEDGVFYKDKVPEYFKKKMEMNGISNMFFSKELMERIELEKDPEELNKVVSVVGIDNTVENYEGTK